jgi:hypothetical protein
MTNKYSLLVAGLLMATALPAAAQPPARLVAEGLIEAVRVGDDDGRNAIRVALSGNPGKLFELDHLLNLNDTPGLGNLQLLMWSRTVNGKVKLLCSDICATDVFNTIVVE